MTRLQTSTTEVEDNEIELAMLLEKIVNDEAFEVQASNLEVKIVQNIPVTIKGNGMLLSSVLGKYCP